MAFQVKDFISILASMVNHIRATTRKITDFNVGSVARTMLEAPSIEIDELYQQMVHGLVEGIPTAIYRSFDFELKPAVAASGLLRFSVDPAHAAPIVIPTGTVVSSLSGVQYQTVEDLTVEVGKGHGDVVAVAMVSGAAGNALPDTVTILISSSLGATAVTNPNALSSGRSEETEDERRLRFAEFVKSLARGTVGSLIYAANLAQVLDASTGTVLEQVARVAVDETRGFVVLYVHNGADSTSPRLLEEVVRLIEGYVDQVTGDPVPGYRPAGMRVDVRAMTESPVDVEMAVQVPDLYRTPETQSQIQAAWAAVIRATPSGGALRPVDLLNATLAHERVQGASLVAPTLLVACPTNTVLRPGNLMVTWQ